MNRVGHFGTPDRPAGRVTSNRHERRFRGRLGTLAVACGVVLTGFVMFLDPSGAGALATPSIATTASATITLGSGTLFDTAVVSGRANPQAGETVTFRLYGPNDSACSSAAVFSSTVNYPVAGGPASSAAFTPTSAGTYRWRATFNGDANNAAVAGACNDANESTVVLRANPTISSTASPNVALGGGDLTDTAVVSGRVNPQAGATVTFVLYRAGDSTCASTPAFSPPAVDYPVSGGPVTSPAYTPTSPGTYRWIATYSGDGNNNPVAGTCGDATETTVVSGGAPTISTTASADITLGSGTLTDTATVTGRTNPSAGASVTFDLYGPNNATCANQSVFSRTVSYPIAGGPVTSPAFTPTRAGTYRWIARYSGDSNNSAAAGSCNDAGESTVVAQAPTSITTTASAGITLGAGTLTDTADVSGRVNAQSDGTITFRLFGPDDGACIGTPAFAPAPVPYPAANGPVTSPAFTPTSAGTYRWVATYSGDANNVASASGCNAANESAVVTPAPTSVSTTAVANVTLGGAALSDSAVVSGRMNPQAGATVTFRLFAAGDTTCTGSPIFSPAPVAYPVSGGPVTSPAFTPSAAGTYRWTASYSGDSNNLASVGDCNDANESSVVARANPTIASTASANITLGAGTLSDTAVVSGRVNPFDGATVVFRLYGPGDTACSTSPVFTANTSYPAAGGTVSSPAFTPTAAGTYRWVATYSGDANNNPAAGVCGDASETTTVAPTPVTVTVSGGQTYGSSSPSFTFTGTAPNGTTFGGTASCTRVTTGAMINGMLPAGSYTLDPGFCTDVTLSGAGASNYAVAYAGGSFVVGKAPVAVTVKGAQTYGTSSPSFTYVGTAPADAAFAGTVACTTVNGGTAISASLTTGGSYTIDGSSCSGLTFSGAAGGNYQPTYTGSTFTVSAAAVTITSTSTTASQSVAAGKITFTTTVRNASSSALVSGVNVTVTARLSLLATVTCTAPTVNGVATCTSTLTNTQKLALRGVTAPKSYTATTPASTNYKAGSGTGAIQP